MKDSTGNNYRRRLCKVINHIHRHLDEDLDVNQLADIALMSPYHFHRIYRQMAQETVNATVRRLRLQKAAADLIRTDLPLSQIAKNLSYTTPEAFSRAFSKQYGETPSAYRNARNKRQFEENQFVAELPEFPKEGIIMYQVEIVELDALQLVGYSHCGDYMQIGNAFEKLFIFAGSKGLIRPQTRSVGIYYNDPGSVETSDLRSHACISVQEPLSIQDDNIPENINIPAGRCATILFKGPYAELENPYNYLFGEWLPQSGHEAADFPPFEEYLNDPKSTPPSELLTRIHCLLAE